MSIIRNHLKYKEEQQILNNWEAETKKTKTKKNNTLYFPVK